MMTWVTSIAMTVAAVLVNHLGLIAAIEDVLGRIFHEDVRLPIVNCGKCLSFWSVAVFVATEALHLHVALWECIVLPPLMAYAAVWFNLFLGYLDTLYNNAYDALYTNDGRKAGALSPEQGHDDHTDDRHHSNDAVSEVR